MGGAIAGAITSLFGHCLNSLINKEKLTLKGIGKAIRTGGLFGAIGGIISLTPGGIAIKALLSTAVGIAEGIKTAKGTSGTKAQTINAGLQSGLLAAGATLIGSLINLPNDAIGVFVKTLNVSTGLGLLTAAESAIINYINKKTTKTKTQTKARVSVQRGKVVYKKNVKIATRCHRMKERSKIKAFHFSPFIICLLRINTSSGSISGFSARIYGIIRYS